MEIFLSLFIAFLCDIFLKKIIAQSHQIGIRSLGKKVNVESDCFKLPSEVVYATRVRNELVFIGFF